VTDQVRRLLAVLAQGEQSAAVLLAELGLRHSPSFRKNYLDPAIDDGLVERTQPDSPRSPTQRYRLTAKGRGKV
ncbi:MAG: Fic family protein, partial [Desulfovibrio sp.]|nr:Fic family protein [Desulfovibrio sp.]